MEDSMSVEELERIIAELTVKGKPELKSLRSVNENVCKSIRSYKDHLRSDPTNAFAIGQLYIFLQICCDWTDFDDRMRKLSSLIDDQLQKNLEPPVDTISAATKFPLGLQQQLAIATYYSKRSIKVSTKPPIEFHLSGKQLRIGYILTGPVEFPLFGGPVGFNSGRFEVFYYCLLDDPSLQQQLVGDWNDHVIDLSTFGANSRAAANRIASDDIQILINLDDSHSNRRHDHTDNPSAVLAHRPAPIQAVYRTSLGSTGASYVDYFITDKVASPLQFAYGYSEKLAYVPNGMLVCHNPGWLIKPQENLEQKEKLRKLFHLPESGIVFGVQSQSYHIDPETFECWCEILHGVPGSVLWFSIVYMKESRSNLKMKAKKHKINPNRLIFIHESMVGSTDPASTNQLFDVLLDTPMCNGLALMYRMCMGVPIVTLPRESFTSRLTASMLTSIGRKELIAKWKSEYVEMAVKLGNSADLLKEMKVKLRENLPDSNLVRQYFVDLEILYEMMWKLREMGEKPEHIV